MLWEHHVLDRRFGHVALARPGWMVMLAFGKVA
jgi:hypothetical protein